MDMISDARHVAAHEAAREGARLARSGEYLTFRLGEEEYGIDILRVQEIRSYEAPTRIANSPAHILGVVNLRGVIVPIVDLRLMLGCTSAEFNHLTVVVVLNVGGSVVGAVVDSVSDVMELPPAAIQNAPAMQASAQANAIIGIGTIKTEQHTRMLILLDIEGLVASSGVGGAAAR